MIRLLTTVFLLTIISCLSNAQASDNYSKLPNGLEYKILLDRAGNKAKEGDIAKINIVVKVNDSVVYDSKMMNNNEPVTQQIQKGVTLADLMDGFMLMSQGDQFIFRAHSDSIFPNPQHRPPFISSEDIMYWEVEMEELSSEAEIKATKAKQALIDQKLMQQYIKDKKLKTTKYESGLHIVLKEKGTDELVGNGRLASIKYTGHLLDGSVFDSNEDPKFQHTNLFKFPVGQGSVIAGWNEAVALLTVGSKATILIPSGLGYDSHAIPGNEINPKGIPAYSPLVFDIEVVSVEDIPDINNLPGVMPSNGEEAE